MDVTKMKGNFVGISFQAELLRIAPKSQEFRVKFACITFAQLCSTLFSSFASLVGCLFLRSDIFFLIQQEGKN